LKNCFDRVSLLTARGLTTGDVLPRFAAFHADDPLVEEPGGRRLSYARALDLVERWAAGIARCVFPGGRVVIATPNGYDQFLLALAACRAGCVAVPVIPLMRASEIDGVILDSGASLVIRSAADAPVGSGRVDRDPAWLAAIFYTSGTTGRPKGAELTHRAVVGQIGALAALRRVRRDEVVASLPVAHIMGFTLLMSAMAAGVPTYFLPRFDAPDVLDAIERRRSTLFVGVPSMYRGLLAAGASERDLSSVRVWVSGADVMPTDLARQFQKMGALMTLPLLRTSLGDAAFVEGYGLVETGGAVAARLSPPGLALPLPGILGIPLPRYRFRVVGPTGERVGLRQIGELLVKGPGVLAGYHGDAAATAAVVDEGGWLHTGDLVRRELFGVVTFAGRAKDVIKSGGYSVYALEIERVMEEHPSVLEAAAVGIPDERLGELAAVAVRVRPGVEVSEEGLLAWGADRLASYKRPRVVRIVSELPRTGTQKVAKNDLRAAFASVAS
jgi:acyl-CoA synthetase (AMP-forming)/AMP-acid ligase II